MSPGYTEFEDTQPDSEDVIASLRARVAELEAALKVLYEEADGFNVSGVYFSEPCMGHKGLEMARASLPQESGK